MHEEELWDNSHREIKKAMRNQQYQILQLIEGQGDLEDDQHQVVAR